MPSPPPHCRFLLVAGALLAAALPAAERGSLRFRDATAESGLDFVHFNGMVGDLYFSEMMGSGVALVDYDGDGDLDVYLVQGAMLGPEQSPDEALIPPRGEPIDRLYRNDLAVDAGGAVAIRLVDVTAAAGLDERGNGMGVAVGDVDGDGRPDLYVTNLGPNVLLHNLGDGTFEEATRRAGVGDDGWGVPAVFFDYDRDGRLDLYVGNYVDYGLALHKECVSEPGRGTTAAPSPTSPRPTCSIATGATGPSRSSRAGPGSVRSRRGLSAPWSWTPTATAGWICMSRTTRYPTSCG
ncbi:MAG: VCBS repeat-containing protein [Thermoanaerobaculia bacterium]